MIDEYRKNGSGLSNQSPKLTLPVTKGGENINFFYGTAENKKLFCIVEKGGLRVYEEKTLVEIFSCGNIVDIVCILDNSVLLFGRDAELYEYNFEKNELNKLPVEAGASCIANQNHDKDYFIALGKDPEDSSHRRAKHYIYKYSKIPFDLQWKVPSSCRTRVASFLIDEKDDVFFCISNKAVVSCHCLETGRLVWEHDISRYLKGESEILKVHPVLFNNAITLVYEKTTISVSTKDCKLLWENPGKGAGLGIVLDDYVLYQLGFDNFKNDKTKSLLKTDVRTGEVLPSCYLKAGDERLLEKFNFQMPTQWVSSETHIIVGWSNGYITAIDPNTGRIDWSVDLGGGQEDAIMPGMMISNNRLYCRTARSNVNDMAMKSYIFEGAGGFGAK